MSSRLSENGFQIRRLDPSFSNYKMLDHEQESRIGGGRDKYREDLTNTRPERLTEDGLNNLSYQVIRRTVNYLYQKIVVDL